MILFRGHRIEKAIGILERPGVTLEERRKAIQELGGIGEGQQPVIDALLRAWESGSSDSELREMLGYALALVAEGNDLVIERAIKWMESSLNSHEKRMDAVNLLSSVANAESTRAFSALRRGMDDITNSLELRIEMADTLTWLTPEESADSAHAFAFLEIYQKDDE